MRIGADELLSAELDTYVGNLLAVEDKLQEGAAHLERALAVYEWADNLLGVDVLNQLASIRLEEGAVAEGLAATERGREWLERTLGAEHARLRPQLVAAAFFLRTMGDFLRAAWRHAATSGNQPRSWPENHEVYRSWFAHWRGGRLQRNVRSKHLAEDRHHRCIGWFMQVVR